jgi:Ca2+-binding RTX toxin-like protein
MTTFNVSTTASLTSALAGAQGGDTILLGAGTYANVAINNVKFAQDVTIASANPGAPAILTGLSIAYSSGLKVQGLELKSTAATNAWGFSVGSSSDIHLSGLKVHGSLDGNPGNDSGGLLVRDSSDVSITGSEFQQLGNAIGHIGVNGLVVSGNTVHDIRSDGMQGAGSSNVTISGNTFRDFRPAAGDHPDAIQFFTTNTTTSAQNITITDNVIMRGSGAQVQGIFLGEEARTLPYINVTISGNFLAGTMYNGISVDHARNVVAADNVVLGFADMPSWLDMNNIDGIKLTDNAATSFLLNKLTNVINTGSTTLALATDQGAAAYQAWLAGNSTTPPATVPAAPTQPAPTPPPTTSPLAGTAGADTLRGTLGADSITGQGGNDNLSGAAGADTLDGGAGADTLDGGDGADVLRGGAGADFYFAAAGDSVVENTAGAAGGIDLVYGYASFTLGANLENLQLGSNSAIDGFGNELANSLTGNAAANRLEGRAGADILNGRDGADTLNGGAGADLLVGGPGTDRFVLARGEANGDRIQDFAAGDRLELHGYGVGSTIAKVAGSATDWKIVDAATGSVDVIKLLNAYQLSGGDFLFG